MFWMRTEPGRSNTLLMESVVDGNAMVERLREYGAGVGAVIISAAIKAEITDDLSTCFPKRVSRRRGREPCFRVPAETW